MFATSGRARIAYESVGVDGGAEVLLIHAGVNDRRAWRHVVDRLAPRHRCVSYDMRGYGETTYEREEGWSPVADAVAVLDTAGVERAVVVAGSRGGLVAIDLFLARPDRVAALLLIGSDVRGAPEPVLGEGPTADLIARIEAAYEADDLAEVERLEAWMWLDGPASPEGRVRGAPRELFLDMVARVHGAAHPGSEAEAPDAWPRLGEIAVPTLVLVGRLDSEYILAVDAQLAEAIPGARLVHLEGVAHVPHLEGDPATLDAIAAFVDAQA